MFALLARDALVEGRQDTLQYTIKVMTQAASIRAVQITDTQGRTLLSSDPLMNGKFNLLPAERRNLPKSSAPVVFKVANGDMEAVAPVIIEGRSHALVWVYPSDVVRRGELIALLRLTVAFALIGAIGCIVLAVLLANSITRPLYSLLQATRRMIRDPEDTSKVPVRGSASSEAADLTTAFNMMVASIEEQRAGLNDTLGLLDSMLANAPIGLAFFDTKSRFVRMNQFLADLNRLSISRHLGRPVMDVFPGPAGKAIKAGIERVFATTLPVRDIEATSEMPGEPETQRSWLINIYPVQTATQTVRWAGAIMVETTERKRAEEALRRTEKLAAVGQLSSSIAHEINNPLEAVTNILYLLRGHDGLDEKAQEYAELAEHEIARVAHIVQQTLRFHRQSTLPATANLGDLFDSVLSLHRGRVTGSQVEVVRRYQPEVELFCFAGEIRQVSNNLIGNALDAMLTTGGTLTMAIRESRSWREPGVKGVRIFVADTGSGMEDTTRKHIFEPFFTTKEATGTGLGLWVSAEIIQKHRGTCARPQPHCKIEKAVGHCLHAVLSSSADARRGRNQRNRADPGYDDLDCKLTMPRAVGPDLCRAQKIHGSLSGAMRSGSKPGSVVALDLSAHEEERVSGDCFERVTWKR